MRMATNETPAASCCAAPSGRWFANPRLLLAAAAAGGLGIAAVAGGWGWLVAAGIAPVLLSVAPCLVMCGLGLCMNRRGDGGSRAEKAAPAAMEAAALPALGRDGDVRRRAVLRTLGAALTASIGMVPLAQAGHLTMPEVERRLLDREQFFQLVPAQPAPGFALQDAAGRPVGLADFRGKVVVLHFVYASCPDVCPLHADRIATIQGMVNQTPMRDLARFISITTDPVHDTPDVMRGFGEAHGLDSANWTFLTSGPEQPKETVRLARAYGLVFVPTPEGQQMHAVVAHVIDRQGQLRAKFHGLDFNPTNLLLYVNALTQDGHEKPLAGPPQVAPARGRLERLWSLL